MEGYINGYRRVFFQGSTDHRGVPGAPGRVVTLQHAPGMRCWGAAYLLAGDYEQQKKTLAVIFPSCSHAELHARPCLLSHALHLYHNAVYHSGSCIPSVMPLYTGPVISAGQANAQCCHGCVMHAQYLEWREKQYDVRERVDVFCAASSSEPVVRGALVYIASEDRTRNLNYLGTAPREAIAQQIAFAVGPSGPNHEYLSNLAAAMQQVRMQWLAHALYLQRLCHACKKTLQGMLLLRVFGV